MSSVGTRGAGPVAKTGAASSDQPTSSRRPLPMTVSPTVGPGQRRAAERGDHRRPRHVHLRPAARREARGLGLRQGGLAGHEDPLRSAAALQLDERQVADDPVRRPAEAVVAEQEDRIARRAVGRQGQDQVVEDRADGARMDRRRRSVAGVHRAPLSMARMQWRWTR